MREAAIGWARERFARSQMSLRQFEREVEIALLRSQPTDERVLPAGWDPLPPCAHDEVVHITVFGSPPMGLCNQCGEEIGL